MTSLKTIAIGLGALAALGAGVAAPGAASAQTYYDACARDTAQRGVTGGVVGATAGAVIGSQLSARGRHTENSLLGGVVGAIAGAAIGKSTSGCTPAYSSRGYYDDRAYDRSYDNRAYDSAYYAPPPPPPPPAPVYVQPAPVYVAPAPVYVAPAPVYVVPRHYRGRHYGWYGY